MPKISVILPFFNRAATVTRCLESVRGQTFADWELIAVDDGSSDRSAELLAVPGDSRIRVIRHEVNRGAGPARDTGMRAANGEYCALIDSDDEWLPGKLKAQLAALETTGAALSSCAFHFIRSGERRTWPKPFEPGDWEKALHRECTFGFGTTLVIRRDVALALGGFDPELPRHEDWDWVLRAFEAGHQLAFVSEVLARVWAIDRVPLDRFIASTERFLAKHDSALRRHGARYRRQVLAHHYESVASMAYEQRRYALGHRYLLRSFCIQPLRNPLPLAALPLGAIDWLLGTRTIQAGAKPAARAFERRAGARFFMSTPAPAVTVLLPVCNGGALLGASIESLLRQTFSDFELLIINDGSTDETPDLLRALRDPRVRILTNPQNLGLTRSLNRGLSEARGGLVARQDADDLSAPDRLEKQIAFLRAHPEVQLLGSCAWRLNPFGRITGANDLPATHDAIRWASVTDNPFVHTSVVFRKATLLAEFGGYDESFAICQDYELWNRVAARHRVANLRNRLVRMREHSASMTRTQAAKTTGEVRRILEANWKLIFAGRTISREEGDLLEIFRLRFPPEKLPVLRQLLDSLLEEFLIMHPNARGSADFRATLCRQSLRLAYKFFSDRPVVALGETARAFCHSPREWLIQGWTALSHPASSR